jgi:transcriptional regulator GlxA family with amidase domain
MLIYVLVLDGVFDIGLASLTDVLGTANELIPIEDSSLRLDVRLVGVRRQVKTGQGLTVPVLQANAIAAPDVVLIPAMGQKMSGPLLEALSRRDVLEAGVVLNRWAQAGASVGAACTGTFVLAETGLLNGHCATTSWWLSALFRQRYPLVKLDESRMLVKSDCFTTAGAALAHLDLALGVVRNQSPSLAALCARYLLIEPRSSQSAFVITGHIAHADPLVERFESWARGRLDHGFSMAEAAVAIGASERTLGRRLQSVLGKSPLAYFQDLRVERAVHLLQNSHLSIDYIADRVGYAGGATLRALLRRKLGKGVRELRKRGDL